MAATDWTNRAWIAIVQRVSRLARGHCDALRATYLGKPEQLVVVVQSFGRVADAGKQPQESRLYTMYDSCSESSRSVHERGTPSNTANPTRNAIKEQHTIGHFNCSRPIYALPANQPRHTITC
jgi:hypothetical protein